MIFYKRIVSLGYQLLYFIASPLAYSKNDIYSKTHMPWIAYKNFWWILDEKKGEFAAIGTNGQVMYQPFR